MKAQPSKSKEQAKVKKPAAKAKPAAKTVPKTKVARSVPARTPKPAAKAKPAAKPVAKKAATKPAVKKAVPAKAAKPAAKPAAKAPAKAPVKAPAKKSAVKAPAKPVAKAAPKAPAKAPVKAASKPAAKPAPAPKTAAKPVAAPVPSTVPSAAPKPLVPVAQQAVAPKPARSSKLAALTVPSLPPAVASTAAKASYLQTMPSPVLAPPPQVTIKKDPKLANNWKTKSVDQMTDAEVLAMPDSEYMNDKQMAFFRFKLSQLKQEILNSAGETTEHLREETVVVPDPADRATIEEEHALELRTRDRERKLLKKIEQSIQRIDAGDYGYCDETGEPIGVGRLLARPTATLSLEAQQRRELKQKMFGD